MDVLGCFPFSVSDEVTARRSIKAANSNELSSLLTNFIEELLR
jgi:hypothetical protein